MPSCPNIVLDLLTLPPGTLSENVLNAIHECLPELMTGSADLAIIPLTSTFLNFITYGFGAVRLAALLDFQSIYVMDWDEFGPSKDSTNETSGAYSIALKNTSFGAVLDPPKCASAQRH